MPQDQDDIKGVDAMKQAPTPGPLDSDDVKLLVKGDLLRSLGTNFHKDGEIVRFESISAKDWIKIEGKPGHYSPKSFAFVFRPPALSRDVAIDISEPAFSLMQDFYTSAAYDPNAQRNGDVVLAAIRYTHNRLAPPAPVEASGSEREAMEAVMASVDPAIWPGLSADHRAALGRFAKPQALRPQPSGETRDAVARIVDPETFALIAHYSGIERFDGLTPEQREPDVLKGYPDLKAKRDAAYADADRILALGDQQGDNAELIADLRRYRSDCTPSQMEYALSDGLAIALEKAIKALSTIPARAEAPDEGAAGELVTLAACPPGLFLWNGTLGFKSEYGAMEPADLGKTWTVGNRADAYCADSGEYFWGGTSNHDDRAKVMVTPIDAYSVAPKDGVNWKAEWEAVCSARIADAALRPQPSGETREAVARSALHDADDISGRIASQGYRASRSDVECLRNHVRKLVALIRPAPVASGGQQELLERINLLRNREFFTPEQANAGLLTLLDECLAALSTTPARAEAPDEGAAAPSFRDVFLSWHEECGTVERAGPCASSIGKFEARWPDFHKRLWDAAMKSSDALRDEWVKIAKESARPSPTPAADADRVRIAVDGDLVEKLARFLSPMDFQDFRRSSRNQHAANKAKTHYRKLAKRILKFRPIAEALAALKSTAAKEGGAHD